MQIRLQTKTNKSSQKSPGGSGGKQISGSVAQSGCDFGKMARKMSVEGES